MMSCHRWTLIMYYISGLSPLIELLLKGKLQSLGNKSQSIAPVFRELAYTVLKAIWNMMRYVVAYGFWIIILIFPLSFVFPALTNSIFNSYGLIAAWLIRVPVGLGAGFATAFAAAWFVTYFGGIVLTKPNFALSIWLGIGFLSVGTIIDFIWCI
jgi:hypothetical protein